MEAQDTALNEELLKQIINEVLDVFKPYVQNHNFNFLDIAEVLGYTISTAYKMNIPDEEYDNVIKNAHSIADQLLDFFKSQAKYNNSNMITQLMATSGFSTAVFAMAASFLRKNLNNESKE